MNASLGGVHTTCQKTLDLTQEKQTHTLTAYRTADTELQQQQGKLTFRPCAPENLLVGELVSSLYPNPQSRLANNSMSKVKLTLLVPNQIKPPLAMCWRQFL